MQEQNKDLRLNIDKLRLQVIVRAHHTLHFLSNNIQCDVYLAGFAQGPATAGCGCQGEGACGAARHSAGIAEGVGRENQIAA